MNHFDLVLFRSSACALLLALVASPVAALDGRFLARVDGTDTRVELKTVAGRVSGQYVEGALQFRLEGELAGTQLRAWLIEPRSGLQVAMVTAEVERDGFDARIHARNPQSGETASIRARFRREGRAATTVAENVDQRSGSRIDPALVGIWIHEENINSGGSDFASFSTRMSLHLNQDGSVEQWSESVGGGGDWSYGGGEPRLKYRGLWQAADGVLQVRLEGMSSFQPAARYRFSEAYLVTEQDSGRRIWRRQQ